MCFIAADNDGGDDKAGSKWFFHICPNVSWLLFDLVANNQIISEQIDWLADLTASESDRQGD